MDQSGVRKISSDAVRDVVKVVGDCSDNIQSLITKMVCDQLGGIHTSIKELRNSQTKALSVLGELLPYQDVKHLEVERLIEQMETKRSSDADHIQRQLSAALDNLRIDVPVVQDANVVLGSASISLIRDTFAKVWESKSGPQENMLETAVIQLGEISLGISQIYEILPDVLCELQEQRLETARMTHLIESSMLEEISSPDPGTTRLPQLSLRDEMESRSNKKSGTKALYETLDLPAPNVNLGRTEEHDVPVILKRSNKSRERERERNDAQAMLQGLKHLTQSVEILSAEVRALKSDRTSLLFRGIQGTHRVLATWARDIFPLLILLLSFTLIYQPLTCWLLTLGNGTGSLDSRWKTDIESVARAIKNS